MADRPGDPDAALVRETLESAKDFWLDADAGEDYQLCSDGLYALDRLVARLSEAEQLNETLRRALAEAQAFNAEGSRRLSVYEQALREIADPKPTRAYGDWHDLADIARAALTTEPGQPAT